MDPDPKHDAWIEKVVKVTSALGMNPTRTRWKLIRWQESRRKAARQREQKLEHIRYEHKTCDECGSVQDRDATVCSRCDAKLGTRTVQVARRIGLIPRSVNVSMLVAVAMLAVYARVLVAQGGGLGSPPAALLFDFGGNWAPSVADEPWRLLTAVFLHAGLWHIGFNLISTAIIGPEIEELYGRGTMLFLLLATGVLASLISVTTGMAGVGIGASGGISGLIGVAAGYGHRLGTPTGLELRNRMLRWTAYTIIFGFAFNADNRAHAGGAIVGAIFGYAVSPRAWNRHRPVRVIATVLGAAMAIGALAIIFTRTPSAEDTAFDGERTYVPFAEPCRLHFAGDEAAALLEFSKLETASSSRLDSMCNDMLELRDRCRANATASQFCPEAERAFGTFVQIPRHRQLVAFEHGAIVCRAHYAGDATAAKQLYSELAFIENPLQSVDDYCNSYLWARDQCRSTSATTADDRLRCLHLALAFDAFPQTPRNPGSYQPYADACRELFAGNPDGARAALDKVLPEKSDPDRVCNELLQFRDTCRRMEPTEQPGSCALVEAAFGGFLQQPQ